MAALSTVAQLRGEDEQVRIAHVPGTQDEGIYISGVLRKQDASVLTAVPPGATGRKRAALILHGVQAHKNQTYHRALAGALPVDSLRIDFRGNGASSGGPYDPHPEQSAQVDWDYGSMAPEVRDVRRALSWLSSERGYIVDIVIAHSRGCAVMWEYFTAPEPLAHQGYLPFYVAVSGRFDQRAQMNKFRSLKPGGTYEWVVPIGQGGVQRHIVTYDSVLRAAQQPTPEHAGRFPLKETSVLLVHGDHDSVVPPGDSEQFVRVLRARQEQLGGLATDPSRVTLRLVEKADHNFLNVVTDTPITLFDDLITSIKSWYMHRARIAANPSAL